LPGLYGNKSKLQIHAATIAVGLLLTSFYGSSPGWVRGNRFFASHWPTHWG
jgi:hypothetical protein